MQPSLTVGVSTPEHPLDLTNIRGGRFVLAFSASALMALCAHVSVPLLFTPVPLTLQTFAVVLTGFLLGPSLAFASMLLYLAEGTVGLPVFSPAGPGGLAQLLGATGGYLLAYPFAAAIAGFVVRAFGFRCSRFSAALVAGTAAILFTLLVGAAWVSLTSHATWRISATMSVAPFLPGEVIKVIAAAGAFASLRRYVRH